MPKIISCVWEDIQGLEELGGGGGALDIIVCIVMILVGHSWSWIQFLQSRLEPYRRQRNCSPCWINEDHESSSSTVSLYASHLSVIHYNIAGSIGGTRSLIPYCYILWLYIVNYRRSGNFCVKKLSYDKLSCKEIFVGTTPYRIVICTLSYTCTGHVYTSSNRTVLWKIIRKFWGIHRQCVPYSWKLSFPPPPYNEKRA